MFISDKIQGEYKEWGLFGAIVLVTAPTGSGKSYFILHKYLDYCAEKEWRILYLVNRRILKEQIEKEKERLPLPLQSFIEIRTYQTIEDWITEANRFKRYDNLNRINNYQVVVCDEAHYFSSDSFFNTRTQLSFDYINLIFESKIRIFMSATPEEVFEVIQEQSKKIPYSAVYKFPLSISYNRMKTGRDRRSFEYVLPIDYSNINICDTIEADNLPSLICDSEKGQKWLVFVDSISYGKLLHIIIEEKFSENNDPKTVIFLNASYKSDSLTSDEVDYITEKEKQKADVLICTSVMDNGINLKDTELRNIVLSADTREEFLQMLGRKRFQPGTNEKVDLYIVEKTRKQIKGRLHSIEKIRKLLGKYFIKEFEQIKKNAASVQNEEVVNQLEYSMVIRQNDQAVHLLVNEGNSDITKLFYYPGNNTPLMLNIFAINRIEKLFMFYSNILDEMEKGDEHALLKRQLSWLGFDAQKQGQLIQRFTETELERLTREVNEKLEEQFIVKPKLDRNETKEFEKNFLPQLRKMIQKKELVKSGVMEQQKYHQYFQQNDRPISEDYWKILCNNFSLEYYIRTEKEGKKTNYIIEKK